MKRQIRDEVNHRHIDNENDEVTDEVTAKFENLWRRYEDGRFQQRVQNQRL